MAGTKCYVKKARRFLFLTEKQPFSDKYQKLFSLTCCCFFQSVDFADEPPTWGHPPDPKVQSKSFKRLQKHLQEADEDGMYKVLEFFVLPLNSKVPPSQARVRPGSPTVIWIDLLLKQLFLINKIYLRFALGLYCFALLLFGRNNAPSQPIRSKSEINHDWGAPPFFSTWNSFLVVILNFHGSS